MSRFFGIARDEAGNTIASATVTVYAAGTLLTSSLFSDVGLSLPKPNPFATNSDGTYDFFAATGEYKISITKAGFAPFTQDYIQVGSIFDHGALSGNGDDDHAQYLHLSNPRTISAVHTFNPGTAGQPFVLGANALGQLVTGLNSDTVDGAHASAFALIAGKSGGQSLTGGTGASESLTLASTSHGTKGSIFLGTSSYFNQTNNRLGINTLNALTTIHAASGSTVASAEVGGLLISGASASERLGLGYETSIGAWLQSTLSGTASTSLRLNPQGGNVGVGATSAPTTRLLVLGSDPNTSLGSSTSGALRVVNTDIGAAGRLVELQLGCSSSSLYAAISGYLTNGGGNTMGDIIFSNRNATSDTSLTQRLRIDSTGRITIGSVAGTTGMLNVWSTLDGVTSGWEVRNTASGHAVQGYVDNTNGKGVIRTPGSTNLVLGTQGVDRLMIDYSGNVYLNTSSTGASSQGVISLGNATAIPTGNATGAYLLYSQAGALKGRGASGTITTIGAADPHCPVCERDFALEWESERYGYLAVCVWCLTEGLDSEKGVFARREAYGADSPA